MSENALTVRGTTAMMPAMDMTQAAHRRNELVRFVQDIMIKGTDFGVIPGTEKATLFKPGAEKLTTFFGLSPRFEIIKEVEQWDGDEPMFYYLIRCRLYQGDVFVGEADASCNSRESRYRFRWVSEGDVPPGLDRSALKRRGGKVSEFTFAVDKAETGGQYGKPSEYWQAFKDAIDAGAAHKFKKATSKGKQYDAWEIDMAMYRVPNEDIFSQVNTILKMAEKRALVAATLVTVNASEFFTQDLEDLDIIDVPHTVTTAPAAPAARHPADIAESVYDNGTAPWNEPPLDPGHAADIAEAKRELGEVERKSWPSGIVTAIIDARLAGNVPNTLRMLNLSRVLNPTDELEFVMTWANHYRSAREDKEPPEAAAWADEQMPKAEPA